MRLLQFKSVGWVIQFKCRREDDLPMAIPYQYLQVTPFDETEFVDSLFEATVFPVKEDAADHLKDEMENQDDEMREMIVEAEIVYVEITMNLRSDGEKQ